MKIRKKYYFFLKKKFLECHIFPEIKKKKKILAHIFTKKYLEKFGPVFLTKLSVKSFSPLYPCELSAYVFSIHY